ncbi:hypothetical protein ACFCYX_02825 [Streptomyces populi]|uniref:hypothetical protein n=1 Tax=Streptomyces populi TaxID=2058924 RepID=UPI0013A6CEC1|nr:hypothetical protein [Streptomyces populi]
MAGKSAIRWTLLRPGDVEGLRAGLAAAEDEFAQIDRCSRKQTFAGRGMPTAWSEDRRVRVRVRVRVRIGRTPALSAATGASCLSSGSVNYGVTGT